MTRSRNREGTRRGGEESAGLYPSAFRPACHVDTPRWSKGDRKPRPAPCPKSIPAANRPPHSEPSVQTGLLPGARRAGRQAGGRAAPRLSSAQQTGRAAPAGVVPPPPPAIAHWSQIGRMIGRGLACCGLDGASGRQISPGAGGRAGQRRWPTGGDGRGRGLRSVSDTATAHRTAQNAPQAAGADEKKTYEL